MLESFEQYMYRCLQLARMASGAVLSNPMVGAVLVHDNKVIGEGYHHHYGEPHAEEMCLRAVEPALRHLIPASTLYVSLEPCTHFGKTPPCTDLILRSDIKKVVVGCRDPFPAVDGKGIEKLRMSGVKVVEGVLNNACKDLNKRFFRFHTEHRPYIILKWAQTADAKVGFHGSNRLLITETYTNRLVHKWRSEENAVMIGTNTARHDNPLLTNRHWSGNSPIRIIVDRKLSLPPSLHLFNSAAKTVIFNSVKNDETGNVIYHQVTNNVGLVKQVVNGLYRLGIVSVMIEGGTFLLQSFINEGYWDEARVITNPQLICGAGVAAPVLSGHKNTSEFRLNNDRIELFEHVGYL